MSNTEEMLHYYLIVWTLRMPYYFAVTLFHSNVENWKIVKEKISFFSDKYIFNFATIQAQNKNPEIKPFKYTSAFLGKPDN